MTITSTDKIPIEEGFKVEAGPGAGKTDFLVNHIKNVIQNSDRLSCTRKVACITYTNTGVETILQRLGKSVSGKVEVSTIHSFLYRNVVKPYATFIPQEYEADCSLLNGHDDFFVNRRYLDEWLADPVFDSLKHPNTRNQLLKIPKQFAALEKWLQSMQCYYEKGAVSFGCDDSKAVYSTDGEEVRLKGSNLKILSAHLEDLKKIYWRKGKIDHNDVLFFSVVLINHYPFILDILRAKFPYIFLDEYQDTSPVQAYIVDRIKKRETIIGVIGDKSQSIYSFQGANPSLFKSFKVPKGNQFTIVQNHRSSEDIVRFLNVLRDDIKQEPCNGKSGNSVCVIVGDRISAYQKALDMCGNTPEETITSLSRNNITSNAMKKDIDDTVLNAKLLEKYRKLDTSGVRRSYIENTVRAVELAKNGKFKEAIKNLEHTFRNNDNPKKQALYVLSILLREYFSYSNDNLMKFYEVAASLSMKRLSGFRKGNAKSFYEDTSYQSIAVCMNIPEDTSAHITIHKSKGAQFRNVFVVGNDKVKKALLEPKLGTDEEHRIAYVAFSRAQNRLFIQFDAEVISPEDEKKLSEKFNMLQIIRL